jgi:RimJ/RimL family protein N-acetyltransferase
MLRPMRAGDVDSLLLIFSDPRVMTSFDNIVFDRAQMEQWVQRNLEHQSQYGYGLFSVIDRSTQLLIGDCGLEHMDVDGMPQTELGYDFRSDYWNRGLATEAAQAVRDYAFQTLNLPRLISLIRQGNLASRRVAEKIGMRLEANVTRYGHDYWVFAISS